MVYVKVTLSPYVTGLASVSKTFVPDTATAVTPLEVPFTETLKAEIAGTMVARARLKEGSYQAVLSLGCHPTLPEGGVTLEVYLLNGPQDLYGKNMRVKFLKKLRDEIKFDGVPALKEQIGRDVRDTKAYFNKP